MQEGIVMISTGLPEWQKVLDFWFPEGLRLDIDANEHRDHWMWRMRGGADEQITAKFSGLTDCAVRGELDQWKDIAQGRLALIIVLDQFSRSTWRNSPKAFA